MDLREFMFNATKDKQFTFNIFSQQQGVIAGTEELREQCSKIGISIADLCQEGSRVEEGSIVLKARGTPLQIILAEECLLGVIGKPSGIATAARMYAEGKPDGMQVVCGAWKKVDLRFKDIYRRAISLGGIPIRISESPFIYLDKNYVRMLGGIVPAVRRAVQYDPDRAICVQIRGEYSDLREEARQAIVNGASIIMADTGVADTLGEINQYLVSLNIRHKCKLAFSGGVTYDMLAYISEQGADIVDVGREIIDAPMLDFKLDVEVD